MNPPPQRLGYYVIGVGVILQFLGLAGDAWLHSQDGEQTSHAILTFSDPTHALLVAGVLLTAAGALVGLSTIVTSATAEALNPHGLRPAMPFLLVAVLSLGSAAFAYQVGHSSSDAPVQGDTATADQASGELTPLVCPAGQFWHAAMNHCMAVTASAPSPLGATPTCPPGQFWHAAMNHCMAVTASALLAASQTSDPLVAACPSGTFWHEPMGHCMALTSSSNGTAPPTDSATPSCPAGTAWHAAMGHCMAFTPAPEPGATATAPLCPAGTAWHEPMGHCMAPTPTPTPTSPPAPACPPGRTWDPQLGRCVPISTVPTPQPTSTECPPGFRWHPKMGHCMDENLFSTPTPTPTATPTP